MVRLELPAFEEACRQMKTHSGIHKMRIMVKARPCNRVVVLKATDDKVAVTSSIRGLNEFKVLERILGEYVGSSMALAPLVAPEEANNNNSGESSGKKNKNKGKKNNASNNNNAGKKK